MHKYTKKYSVLTKNGFKKFDGIKKSKHNSSLKFYFTDGSDIQSSLNHLFNTSGEIFTEANKLKVGDSIGDKKIRKIEKINQTVEMFDLLNVEDGHHYITSGVTSHNCAFIRQSVWEEFSDSIFPSQSGLSWKKNIILSTANGMNHFYQMVKSARTGDNGMNIFEVDWKDVPRYSADGTLMSPEEFQNKIIRKHGIVYFNQNYANEFLGSSHTLISSDKLKEMTPAEVHEKRDGKLNIYEYPQKGHKYIMTVDASKDGSDAFAVQIVDITDFKFVQAATANLQIDYLLMPEFLNEWAEYYNNPYLIIENNEGAGQSIADQMYNDYEYENLHFDKKTDSASTNLAKSRKKYPGFRTTPKTRKQILQTLKLFIENDNLVINDKTTIDEFYQFILINNKYQADDGAHDDMIMSLAMVFVPFCNTKNFEDMKKLVKALYASDESEREHVDFGELLTIGSFDSGTDEDYIKHEEKKIYLTMEEALMDQDGFV